jgi:membrane protein DedA with SNARE-associated domain
MPSSAHDLNRRLCASYVVVQPPVGEGHETPLPHWCDDPARVKRSLLSQPHRQISIMLEALESYAHQIVEFVRAHEAWAAPIVFALAFGESLAFISLLVPAWGALVAIGYLIGPSGISFWPVCIAGALGAAFGDWLSYWVGIKLGPPVAHVWPLSRHPDLLPRGERFMKHWGVPAIFIGRFFGPLRASVPLVAGILAMPYWHFQFANFTSAFVWSGVLLTLGDVVSKAVSWIWT